MLYRRGRGVYWERAMKCSCYNEYSGNPNIACKACEGRGYIYDEPIYEDAVAVQGLVVSKNYTPIGEYQMGDAVCTVPYKVPDKSQIPYSERLVPMFWIGEFDRVTLMTSEFKYTDTVIRGTWFRQQPPDTLRHRHITDVIRVLQSDPDTGQVTIYEPGVDYELDGRTIKWLDDGNSPAEETFYTVMYRYHPTYTVYTELPQARDQDGQHFPRKVILRLESPA